MISENKVDVWHETAMDLAEMAFFSKRKKDYYHYWKYIQRALNYEKAAAKVLMDSPDVEPTRSILYLGAIHLALNLDHFEEARHLLSEAIDINTPTGLKEEFKRISNEIQTRERIKSRILAVANDYLESDVLDKAEISRVLNASIAAAASYFGHAAIAEFMNRPSLEVYLESKNLVTNPNHQIFEDNIIDKEWIVQKRQITPFHFWNAYKIYLQKKNFANTTIHKLDLLTDDILSRFGDPSKKGVWDKRGMIVGDVQSGKTSNYIGLINKAADLGFRIVIVLTGLYESLRQQTQERIDEGFIGFNSDPNNINAETLIGVGNYRNNQKLPVHPITKAGEAGDLSKNNLPNLPINTNDYYAIVVKKNPNVLKALLNWLYNRGEKDGDYRIIKDIPLLVIDDEADYASINVDREFVSKINASIRSILALFEQSAFIGYTATPFANVFISDHNDTENKEIILNRRKFRLGEELFPRDFIINIPPPSNYIGYTKVFDTQISETYTESELPMINIIKDFEDYIPRGHKKSDATPSDIPDSLKYAVRTFVIVCAIRIARGQHKEHNSMLIHVSWYVQWIDNIALLVNKYVEFIKQKIKDEESIFFEELKSIWEKEFKNKADQILKQVDYEDPEVINHEWDEILQFFSKAIDKIEVRAIHGTKKNILYQNITPLDYNSSKAGLSVIAVGGNKLSRGLTLEGLTVSYFLRASRFYDTLLQMGRWFGYRPGYIDLCRLFTTQELITWYQYIAHATDELKEQFDIMDLAERTPKNFGLKVRSAPGMLMISSAAKIKSATDLELSYSSDLLETYILSKKAETLSHNLLTLQHLIEKLGPPSGISRQRQPFIWENISYPDIDEFIANYIINQSNINPYFLRLYIQQQLKNGCLKDWTVVLIHNSTTTNTHEIKTSHTTFNIGYTFRSEFEEKDAEGNIFVSPENYIIRKSHIISPSHEFLDMEITDERYILALSETTSSTGIPGGKFVRKHRGSQNVLLLIYILDPDGFKSSNDLPAVGYAISFPEIRNDEKIPYKVNKQFIEMFAIPDDAEENPENEEE